MNQPPVANFVATPTSGAAPLTVSFDGLVSSDPDGTIASYSWSFGDGGTATGATASHQYVAAGTYNAVLTVRDNLNLTATKTVVITATPGADPARRAVEPHRIGERRERDAALDRQRAERERVPCRARGERKEPAVLANRNGRRERGDVDCAAIERTVGLSRAVAQRHGRLGFSNNVTVRVR